MKLFKTSIAQKRKLSNKLRQELAFIKTTQSKVLRVFEVTADQ